jgi:hypothetical protein
MKRALSLLFFCVVVAACSKQEPPTPAASSAPSAPAAPASPASVASSPVAPPSASTAVVTEPPTEEDFEMNATEQVNKSSLDAQLDALEKEIQSD